MPSWFLPLTIATLLAGWAAILFTLVAMIRTKRAQRLAAEARERETT